jgi:hypothetical protein
MGQRLNWDRAKPFRQTESKYEPGSVLANGAIVPEVWRDDLSRRANLEMDRWLRTLSPRNRARVRFGQ